MKPHIKKIYSENNDYQHLEVLKRNREKRNKYQEFLVEGVKPIEQALHHNWEIKALVFSSERRLSNWARGILDSSSASTHYDLPLELMEKLSDKEDSSEIIAVTALPGNDRSKINISSNLLLVVFDRPSSHGNLGTIIRSCDSLKVDGVILTGHGVDLYDPQTIRASLGSIFAVPVLKIEPNELFAWLGDIKQMYPDLQLIGTSAKAETRVDDLNFTKPTVLFLGNETDGLSKNFKNNCDRLIIIPIYGSATSLNVACAASICLYEIDRQRRNGSLIEKRQTSL
jgi:tRNA G18 (ribose-2'-O)-methylase SpoU